jgi:transposase
MEVTTMKVLYDRCCGLDIHKRSVVACVLTPSGKEVRTFGTMTKDLLDLSDWLTEQGCTHVAMEATGVYWKPIYNLLEDSDLTLLVVNARHIKAVPGRKTDVRDAEWIADLLQHGLLRGSFIPDRSQRELQELIRYRRSLIGERAREVNRIQKVLEGANIKLSSVISNTMGVSGRAMLEALVAGTTDAETMAKLATARLEATPEQLTAALEGRMGAHQRMLLGLQLQHVTQLDDAIERVSAEIEERLRPFEDQLQRLDTIPGVSRRGAQEIIAAIGVDMSRFPSHRHLASWAKLCPGTNESAGKRGNAATGKGNPYLRETLVEAGWAAGRTKQTYLAAQFHRLKGRRGAKRAVVAVAHSILVIAYHILKEDGSVYEDLGPNYFDERSKEATTKRTVNRLERLGYKVTLEPAA